MGTYRPICSAESKFCQVNLETATCTETAVYMGIEVSVIWPMKNKERIVQYPTDTGGPQISPSRLNDTMMLQDELDCQTLYCFQVLWKQPGILESVVFMENDITGQSKARKNINSIKEKDLPLTYIFGQILEDLSDFVKVVVLMSRHVHGVVVHLV